MGQVTRDKHETSLGNDRLDVGIDYVFFGRAEDVPVEVGLEEADVSELALSKDLGLHRLNEGVGDPLLLYHVYFCSCYFNFFDG